jgi:hypothetical protein
MKNCITARLVVTLVRCFALQVGRTVSRIHRYHAVIDSVIVSLSLRQCVHHNTITLHHPRQSHHVIVGRPRAAG